MAPDLQKIRGCLVGTLLGDALGAPHEGGLLERATWAVLGRTLRLERRYSDDTQMTLDLAHVIAHNPAFSADELAAAFARGYSWSRGYGPGAAKILKRIHKGTPWQEASRSVYPEGSFGNGAAMRAPILGVLYQDEALEDVVEKSSIITHAHPLGIDGARIMAAVARAAVIGTPPSEWLRIASDASHTPEMRAKCGEQEFKSNGVAAIDSVPTAIFIASQFAEGDFADLMRFTTRLGGDVDTISSMAAALCGAFRTDSYFPPQNLQGVEGLKEILNVADQLHKRFAPTP